MIRYLIIQGGGASGVAYSGALQILEAAGHLRTLEGVAGTSAGAATATLLALKRPIADILQLISTDFSSFVKDSMGGGLEFLQDAKRLYQERGLNSSKLLENVFEEWFGGATFNDIKIPLEVFAVVWDEIPWRLTKFSYATHRYMKLSKVCAASAAIPLFYTPVTIDGKEYIDGGVLANYPAGAASFGNAPGAVGLRLLPPKPKPSFARGGVFNYAKTILSGLLDAAQLETTGNAIWIDRGDVRGTDFNLTLTQIATLQDAGRQAARKFIADGA